MSLTLTGSATGGQAPVLLLGEPDSTPDVQILLVTADSDSSWVGAIQPRLGNRVYSAGWRVYVSGVLVPNILPDSVSASRALGRLTQVAAFTPYHPSGVNPLGNVAAIGAPATGLKAVDIRLAYRTSLGAEFEIPIITNGVADDTQRSVLNGVTDGISVQDALARVINKRLTYLLPAGSGAQASSVVRSVASAAGMEATNFPQMNRVLNKELHIRKESPWEQLREVLAVPGGHLVVDPDGSLDCVFDNPEAPVAQRPSVRWTLTAGDVVRQVRGQEYPISVRPATEAYTSVKLTGTKQRVRDECGLRTRQYSSESNSNESQPVAVSVQDGAGALTSTGTTWPSGEYLAAKSLTKITDKCGTVVHEVSYYWEMHNPRQYRSTVNTSGVRTYAAGRHVLENGNGVMYPRPKIWQTRITWLSKEFDSEGFLVQVRERVYSPYIPRAHVQSKSGSSWTFPTATYYSIGEDDGFTSGVETRILTSESRTVLYRSGGYLKERRVYESGYEARPGSSYLYDDGREASQASEQFQQVRTVVERWDVVGEQLTRYSIESKNLRGVNTSEASTQQSGPPAVEKLRYAEPLRADFESDEDFAAAKAANRFENDAIEAECDAPT
ncbi:MAG: hypothetical protein WBM50_23325, partial [Acidimicrobiales bacterium]